MNDREFIELLNLYVDHEISAEDALRLEGEVVSNPARREIYDQYCRMQKACSMLSGEVLGSAAADTSVALFPRPGRWGFGPLVAGLAAAAVLALVIADFRKAGGLAVGNPPSLAADASHARPAGDTAALPNGTDSMRPVFIVRFPSEQVSRPEPGPLFAVADAPSQVAELNWIGDIRMTPVVSAANSGLFLNPKTDIRAAVLSDLPNGRDAQDTVEMTAFRFQR